MRMIDAEDLKKVIEEKVTYIDGDSVYKIIDLIDNAPTVPLLDFKEGYKQAIIDGKTNFSRPQGEWITENLEKPYGRCNQCGEICEVDNYCGNCGADMKGGAE